MGPPADDVALWFLTAEERGNPDTRIDADRDDGSADGGVAWTEGNRVRALVHGAEYFRCLVETWRGLERGDLVLLTDWRGDGDERLDGTPGSELATVLVDLVLRGVDVRGLVWRSHPHQAHLSEQEAIHLAELVNQAGGEILLDERVRRAGSHHQKLVLVRHPGHEVDDVAFVGGIDLCHGRRDDERHFGDPQAIDIGPKYGDRAPWHDVQSEIRGPAIGDLSRTFRERWDDPTPLDHRNPWRARIARVAREPRRPSPLPPAPKVPAAAGPHAVQVLRTYPRKRPAFPFATEGERSIARAYRKVFRRARRLIYIEDQYLWSAEVTAGLSEALRTHEDLHLIALVPRYPEQGGRASEPPERVGHDEAVGQVVEAGGDRVAIYDLENDEGVPAYVHAKVCVVDDVWAIVGSDNLNLRSWTHDSELSCAVLDSTRDARSPSDPAGLGDGARVFARDLRLRLMTEHLGRGVEDADLLDPTSAFAAWTKAADELEGWYAGGCVGPRPPGRVQRHRPEPVHWWQRPWAHPIYRLAVDPDGRPRRLRRRGEF